jgi:hypothetical protein
MGRLCHVRYGSDKNTIVDKTNTRNCRIVTVLWKFYPDKNLLIYGATVYTKTSNQDKWVRKNHVETANSRFWETPVTIEFENKIVFSRVAMDRYIASFLVYRYGVKDGKFDNVYKTKGKKNLIKCYDPEYDPSKTNRKMTKEELINLLFPDKNEHEDKKYKIDYTEKLKVTDNSCLIFTISMFFAFMIGISISYLNG